MDYWSGLSEPIPRFFIWNDCTELDIENDYHTLKGESYREIELCYMIRRDSLEWESRRCESQYIFACEKKIQGECGRSTILSSNKVQPTYTNMSTSECESICAASPSCGSGISTDEGLCILLETRTGSDPLLDVTIFQKNCVQVDVVSSVVPAILYNNNNLQPLLNCSAFSLPDVTISYLPEISESTSLVSDISATPCYIYETLNVTNIYNSTELIMLNITDVFNITEIVTVTDFIHVTETVNLTETMIITSVAVAQLTTTLTDNFSTLFIVTSTINITDLYNETEVYNITETYNFTSTVYTTRCSGNSSQFYLSTDDPLLLEAIASMSKELTVDKKKTSSNIRKLTSASDSRPSARTIGLSGLILLIVSLALILLCDVWNALCGVGLMFDRCRGNPDNN